MCQLQVNWFVVGACCGLGLMVRILEVACGVFRKLCMICFVFHRQLVERQMHILVAVFVSFEAAEVVLWKNEMFWACMSCRLLLLKRCAGVCGGLWDFPDNLSKTWYGNGRNEAALCSVILVFVCVVDKKSFWPKNNIQGPRPKKIPMDTRRPWNQRVQHQAFNQSFGVSNFESLPLATITWLALQKENNLQREEDGLSTSGIFWSDDCLLL